MFKDHYFINIFHYTELRIIGKILEKKPNSAIAQALMLVNRQGKILGHCYRIFSPRWLRKTTVYFQAHLYLMTDLKMVLE